MIPRNVWFVRVRTVRGLSGVSIGCAAAKNAPETLHLAVFDAKAMRNLGGKWRKEKAKVGRFEKKVWPGPTTRTTTSRTEVARCALKFALEKT